MSVISFSELTEVKSNTTFSDNTKAKVTNAVNYTAIINTIITVVGISILLLIIYLSKDYINIVLIWVENQNPLVIFAIYFVLFTIVSFPIIIGYLFLIISCGYLLGIYRGMFAVVIAANTGILIAHNAMRFLNRYYPIEIVHNNEYCTQILKVLSGDHAFKIVLCTRLTPIPFGLQNAVFALSTISWKKYHIATLLGLLPAQLINVYLGSTLRDMHDVLDNREISTTGYIVFGLQLVIAISVMSWVLCKARIELTHAIKEVERANAQIELSDSSEFGSNSYILT